MEISGTNMRVTESYGITYTAEKPETDSAQSADGTSADTGQTLTDKQMRAQQFWLEASQNYAEQTASVMGEITDNMRVAQEIYRRMASGAKVSQSDEQTLMEYDSRMYMAAKNAQMMAERKEDLSRDSLTEKFEKRHANDRRDWTSQLESRIAELGLGPDATVSADTAQTTFDVSV